MWLWALTASAQTAYEVPSHVLQGTALRVVVKNPSAGKLTAKLLDKTVPLFRQDSGEWLGLMPVPVAQTPGEYSLTITDGGSVLHTVRVTVDDAHYPKQNIRASKAMKALEPLPGETEAVRALQAS